MHLHDAELALKVFEIGEKVLPEVEGIIDELQESGHSGERPTLLQLWPHIRAALDAAVKTTPLGNIHV